MSSPLSMYVSLHPCALVVTFFAPFQGGKELQEDKRTYVGRAKSAFNRCTLTTICMHEAEATHWQASPTRQAMKRDEKFDSGHSLDGYYVEAYSHTLPDCNPRSVKTYWDRLGGQR